MLAAAAAGCNARVQDERRAWNLFAMEAALDDGPNLAIGPAVPSGLAPGDFLTRSTAGSLALKVQRAFADELPAAYVTSEIWVGYYDAVWPQPLYVQYADPGVAIEGAPRIIDVGPESSFYSPFWQVNLAVLGDVPADRYHSSKEVLDAASQIIPAGMKTCALRPLDVVGTGLALPAPWSGWNLTLQEIPTGEAVYEDDGHVETVGLLDFGHGLFEVEAEDHGAIVEAGPMFVFTKSDGTWATDEPRVLGSGDVLDGAAGPRPRYGGLWRVYEVRLPASAAAFHAEQHPDAAARAAGDPLDYEGRYALDASCFEAGKDFPAGCAWLDSQEKLESLLGAGRLTASNVIQTGPIVLYKKLPVPVND